MKNPPTVAAWLRRLAPCGLCAAALTSLPLVAPVTPETASTDDNIIELSAFTVSSQGADRYRAVDAISAVRVRAPLLDTANSISVITREMMDDLAPSRIFDVTRYVAGIQDGRGLQFQDRMIIRRFEASGQRTVDNFIQPSDADNVDETIIERIEVTKGPNAILSPAGAPGGSINVITKSPLFKAHGSMTALLGTFDAQKRSFDFGGPVGQSGDMAYRVVGSLQDSHRYWDADARLKGKVLAPMFTYNLSPNTQITTKIVAAEH
ncbi:MAG: TonB-dependent receptor plug domain-containing protein [Candidatus Synoicihabitans palmerolidicus]|nr:TonB-dependent receptor plug domain-containing protein [Candidatus Synoicihabitans palmerolidicus]